MSGTIIGVEAFDPDLRQMQRLVDALIEGLVPKERRPEALAIRQAIMETLIAASWHHRSEGFEDAAACYVRLLMEATARELVQAEVLAKLAAPAQADTTTPTDAEFELMIAPPGLTH